jgi:hypothetical protein
MSIGPGSESRIRVLQWDPDPTAGSGSHVRNARIQRQDPGFTMGSGSNSRIRISCPECPDPKAGSGFFQWDPDPTAGSGSHVRKARIRRQDPGFTMGSGSNSRIRISCPECPDPKAGSGSFNGSGSNSRIRITGLDPDSTWESGLFRKNPKSRPDPDPIAGSGSTFSGSGSCDRIRICSTNTLQYYTFSG